MSVQITEEWREIPGHPGYAASSLGRIRSSHGKGRNRTIGNEWRILKPAKSGRGYLAVYLSGRKREYVHRLVLLAFVGPCPPDQEARHFPDSNRRNNAIANLSWGTKQENHADKKYHGTHICGERAGSAKLTADQVAEIVRRYNAGEQRKHLAEEFGLRKENISKILSGKHWKHLDLDRLPDGYALEGFISTRQAASIIGRTRERVHQMIKDGRLKAIECRTGWFFNQQDFLEAIPHLNLRQFGHRSPRKRERERSLDNAHSEQRTGMQHNSI